MASAPATNPRRLPRWWRRLTITLHRSNVYLVLEIAAAVALVAMLITSWLAVEPRLEQGKLLPSTLTAALSVTNGLASAIRVKNG